MGFCYWCGKCATKKARKTTTGEEVYVCNDHASMMRDVQDGKNSGAGAGIG